MASYQVETAPGGEWKRMERIMPEILGRLFDEHAATLALVARQWCDTPDDVVQDAFTCLASQRKVPDRVVPWLFRVVRNRAISTSRQVRRQRQREEKVAGSESTGGEIWFDATDDRIDAAHASRLLAELDRETREVIISRLWGGLTFEEIAAIQGCSVSSAHRRYQGGLTRLYERLEPQCNSKSQTATAKSR